MCLASSPLHHESCSASCRASRRALYPACPELMHGDFAIVDAIAPTKSETLKLKRAAPSFCLPGLYRAGSKICDAMHRGSEKGCTAICGMYCMFATHACMCMYMPGSARSPLPRPAVMQHKKHACHMACSVAAACMHGVRIHCTKAELASRLHGVFVYQEHSCGSSILAAFALRKSTVCSVLCRLRQARLVLLLLHREDLKRAICSSQYCKSLFSLQDIHSDCFQQ